MEHTRRRYVAKGVARAVGRALEGRGIEAAQPPRDLGPLSLRSVEVVNLMLALEAEFEIEFPQADLRIENFTSLDAMETLVLAALPPDSPTP